jgi:hypothetical protein
MAQYVDSVYVSHLSTLFPTAPKTRKPRKAPTKKRVTVGCTATVLGYKVKVTEKMERGTYRYVYLEGAGKGKEGWAASKLIFPE